MLSNLSYLEKGAWAYMRGAGRVLVIEDLW